MALTTDVVVVWAQPLQAHLVEGGPGDGQEPLDVGSRHGVAEQGDQETAVRGLPVEFVKLRVEHGVAAAEAHLGMDVVGAAELVELVEHMHGPGKVHAGAAAAVVAVAAVQVAGLGQVPLQGEGGHPPLVRVGPLTLKKTRFPHQGGTGRQQQPPGGGGDEDIVDAADRDPGLAGRVPAVDPLLDHFQGEQVVTARGAADHRRRRCRPVEQHHCLARLRGQGAIAEEFGQPGPVGLEQAHTRVDGVLADRGRDVDHLRGQPVAGQLQRGEFRQKREIPTAGWMSGEPGGKIVR